MIVKFATSDDVVTALRALADRVEHRITGETLARAVEVEGFHCATTLSEIARMLLAKELRLDAGNIALP